MSYTKDITIKVRGVTMCLRFLPWDTDFFGRPSYLLDTGASTFKAAPGITGKCIEHFGASFVTARFDTVTDAGTFDLMYSMGFFYVGTEVTLKYRATSDNIRASAAAQSRIVPCKVEQLQTNEGLPYEQLGGVFTCDRFHSDPNIRKDIADLLWVRYLQNFKPSPLKTLFVAKAGDVVAGVILCDKDEKAGRVFLSYVAVTGEFKYAGIGSALIRHVVDQYGKFELVTGTQIKNIEAMNFYIKNGFSVIERTRTVLHRWSK